MCAFDGGSNCVKTVCADIERLDGKNVYFKIKQ